MAILYLGQNGVSQQNQAISAKNKWGERNNDII